ncbi:ferredoxin [Nocardioides sp. YIM 152588]|uniref:ferredoxin n=1 Tax=Nocardioides sp. YIM 152588 TaxID=3158259 RepID=UPI0032E40CBF
MAEQLIVVDRGRCTGLGICESIDPDRFEVEDDGSLLLHQERVAEADRALAERAVGSCPAAALTIQEGTPA